MAPTAETRILEFLGRFRGLPFDAQDVDTELYKLRFDLLAGTLDEEAMRSPALSIGVIPSQEELDLLIEGFPQSHGCLASLLYPDWVPWPGEVTDTSRVCATGVETASGGLGTPVTGSEAARRCDGALEQDANVTHRPEPQTSLENPNKFCEIKVRGQVIRGTVKGSRIQIEEQERKPDGEEDDSGAVTCRPSKAAEKCGAFVQAQLASREEVAGQDTVLGGFERC